MSKVIITSYPYVYERYFRVFDFFKNKAKLLFVLPRTWQAKGGAIQAECSVRDDIEIIPTRALFTHSHYPLIKGLMKGWMPALAGVLRRRAMPGDVLYTAIEPNLLTTWANARRAKRLGLKHVFFTWQNVSYKRRLSGLRYRITMAIIRDVIKHSAGAITGNRAAEHILREIAGPAFPILQVPISGIDTERFNTAPDSQFREQYKLAGKIVFLFAGALDERKGLDTLIDAFADVHRVNPNTTLVVIGSGHLKDRIAYHIRKAGIIDAVRMIPWLDNHHLPGIFTASDVFVYPSEPVGGWEEQFGFSIAEASAAGLPVISTRIGAIPEIIQDGVTGILVPPHNSEYLAEAMRRLADDPALRSLYGTAGKVLVVEKYTHAVIAAKMESFFNTL